MSRLLTIKQVLPLLQYSEDLIVTINQYIGELEDIRKKYSQKLIKKHKQIPFCNATISFLQEPYIGFSAKVSALIERIELEIASCERSSSSYRKGTQSFVTLRTEKVVDTRINKIGVDLEEKIVSNLRQLAYSEQYIIDKYLQNDPLALNLMKATAEMRMKSAHERVIIDQIVDNCII